MKETTHLRIGFRGKNQIGLILIWREWRKGDKTTYASAIWSSSAPLGFTLRARLTKLRRNLRNLRILPHKVINNWGWTNCSAYFIMGIPFLTISYWKARKLEDPR